jgi:hypothetical protein
MNQGALKRSESPSSIIGSNVDGGSAFVVREEHDDRHDCDDDGQHDGDSQVEGSGVAALSPSSTTRSRHLISATGWWRSRLASSLISYARSSVPCRSSGGALIQCPSRGWYLKCPTIGSIGRENGPRTLRCSGSHSAPSHGGVALHFVRREPGQIRPGSLLLTAGARP